VAVRSNPTTITFVGHSTVLIDTGEARLLTDPLLRDGILVFLRRHRGLDRSQLGNVDGVLISHFHHDHLDLPSLRALGAGLPIVVPPRGARFLRRRGFSRVTELGPGDATTLAGVGVRGVEAWHRGGRIFGLGKAGAVGYLIEGPPRVYFAGDTELFPQMSALAPGLDVALLPIWGWGRNLGSGHLDPAQAAHALTLLRPRFAVPIHWGSLAPIGARRFWPWVFDEPGRRFAAHAGRLAPDVDVRVLSPGESLRVEKR
jgi:L-ascorbate metabolism protein UlaG (beta-lactamase superfamily)